MYKAVDMQLHKIDKNIPPNFTLAMREGTPEQRWDAGLAYVGNMVHSKNPNIPAGMLPELVEYFSPGSPNYHNPDILKTETYNLLDQQMKNVFGDFVQTGTAKALFKYGQNGILGQPDQPNTLVGIYSTYGINIISQWADKQTGLPVGSTYKIYETYTKLAAARSEYMAAKAAFAAKKITADVMRTKTANYNQVKATAVAFVINIIFEKQLLAVDQKLGLVPGSSAMLVGMAAQYFFVPGGVDPVTIAIFVLINLFGVYKVEVKCSACGYYPAMGGAPAAICNQEQMGLSDALRRVQNCVPFEQMTESFAKNRQCPLGEFNGADENAFQQNAILSAQYKVKQLIGDLLNLPVALKDNNLLPTQIMTLRGEDVENYTSELYSDYGPESSRGNSGLWANDLMWGHIHIGY